MKARFGEDIVLWAWENQNAEGIGFGHGGGVCRGDGMNGVLEVEGSGGHWCWIGTAAGMVGVGGSGGEGCGKGLVGVGGIGGEGCGKGVEPIVSVRGWASCGCGEGKGRVGAGVGESIGVCVSAGSEVPHIVALCAVRETFQKAAVQRSVHRAAGRVVAKRAGSQAEGLTGAAVVEVGNGAAAGAGEV